MHRRPKALAILLACASLILGLAQPPPANAAPPEARSDAQASSVLPVPCKNPDAPEVYLVIDGQRRHIVDWDTFLALGYPQPDIVSCGIQAWLPEGQPVTRLIKGSGDPVYWMENGLRRHIPDMRTFSAMGFRIEDITLLPDGVVTLWPLGAPLPAVASRPVPCKNADSPKVYLLIDGQRRHIVDWDTFLALGYQQPDIVGCGASASLPEGGPITRVLKGSGDPVYWMENGYRRQIPDMFTFMAMGFEIKDVTALPVDVITLWPLGAPIDAAPPTSMYQEVTVGAYTVQLWHPYPGRGMFGFATISANKQPFVKVPDVEGIAALPASDITGEGQPDIAFNTRVNGSAHCCWGTVVYNLGPTPVKVLDVLSIPYYDSITGRGRFIDIDQNGAYEFATFDALTRMPCSQPWITAVLAYDAGQRRYVAASPRFASYYNAELVQFYKWQKPGDLCQIYRFIATLLTIGQTDEAKASFAQLYTGTDREADWARIENAVRSARYYVEAK